MWNWQRKQWPNFIYDSNLLMAQEAAFMKNAGVIVGSYQHVSDDQKRQLMVSVLLDEALKTSEIEGELLDRDSVQSSLQKQLGLKPLPSRPRVSGPEAGVAEVMVDLFRNFSAPLSKDMLCNWHIALMANQWGIDTIGDYRKSLEPIQVVSGAYGRYKVHFEGPPSERVPTEMAAFIGWFNKTAPQGTSPMPALTRAALAHLYFVAIHPFEDGNGRIARALAEKALAQAIGAPSLTSLSMAIQNKRTDYYSALAANNRELTVQTWLEYFAQAAQEGQQLTLALVSFHLAKAKFYQHYQGRLNTRQEKVVGRIFAQGLKGFEGGLSTKNYIAITQAARATATRDLNDLVAQGVLLKEGELKGTRYHLNLSVFGFSYP
jgi:Fic family protein